MPKRLFGRSTSTSSAPASRNQPIACSTACCTAGWFASASRYCFGKPTRRPSIGRWMAAASASSGSTASGAVVASSGSSPAITDSSSAASATVRVNGPTWSSELAQATRPCRLTRP